MNASVSVATPAETLRPRLACPDRPSLPLPPFKLLKTAVSNTLGIFDEAVFDELVVVRRYGPIALAYISDPAGIRHVLVDRFDDYPRLPVIRRIYAAQIGTGSLATSGPVWWRHRRIAAPALDRRAMAPEVLGLAATAEAEADALGAQISGPVNIAFEVGKILTGVLNRAATSGDPRGLPILSWLSKVPGKPKVLDIMPMQNWFRDLVSPAGLSSERAALRDTLETLIAERLVDSYDGPRDLLWRIAHATDRETGERLSLAEARDEAASQMAAGDATIGALSWIWYLIALHPEVEARLHAELDAVLGNDPIHPDHLRALVYTRRVLDEVLRLYPSVPVTPRYASKSDVVCGHKIPRGATVIIAPWVVHRHRKVWSDPEAFDPDRFSEERSRNIPRFAHIPFIVGPGTCSGSHFAMIQMLILVAALGRRYRFRLIPEMPVTPHGGMTLQPRGGLWVTAERR